MHQATNETACVRHEIDEARVNDALSKIRRIFGDFRAGVKALVSDLAEMNETERKMWLDRAVHTDGIKRNLLQRIEACAARGIVDAIHLFDVIQVATVNDILYADPAALRQIANPDYEFAYVDDDGKTRIVLARDLNQSVARRVWDRQRGEISHRDQLRALSRKKRDESRELLDGAKRRAKSAVPLDVVAVHPGDDGYAEINFVDRQSGDEIRVVTSLRKLRKMIGG